MKKTISLFLLSLLAACGAAAPAPDAAPADAPAKEAPAKSTERVMPEVRYYLIADA